MLSTVPKAVLTATAFTSLSAGGYHTCALTAAGAAYCWGQNDSYQLGVGANSTSSYRTVPTAVAGGLSLSAISAGGFHTCGLTTAGAAYCWGHNTAGELGDGTTIARAVPVAVVTQ